MTTGGIWRSNTSLGIPLAPAVEGVASIRDEGGDNDREEPPSSFMYPPWRVGVDDGGGTPRWEGGACG